ncbi:hypothetical protein HOLleu_03860 [Holothuria leucospilota]|uniref:Retroviral polymerase SH3-like domain-containing protein n=1 Tax=Holothuria leucospilota TaxID=206669 RepID=A0A9Q1CRA4_HOLLE|nr:hypothetical protein HOLleu_03860 [Holothuria leucospilota]
MLQAGLPKVMWTYAVMAATYIRNRCYNPRTKKTAFEVFTGQQPNICGMHTFGSCCYAYVQNKKKLDARIKEGVFVGYDKGSPAYLVYFPQSQEVRKVRCVKFTGNVDNVHDNANGRSSKVPDSFDEDVIFSRWSELITEQEPLAQVNGEKQ